VSWHYGHRAEHRSCQRRALGTQLAWALRTAIATGELAAGVKLPSVRELAQLAGVNVNTVRSVYARLEDEGLIGSEHGRGTFVARDAREQKGLAKVAADAIAAARRTGIDPRDLAAALHVARPDNGVRTPPAGLAVPAPASDAPDARAAGRIRAALRGEIAALEAELARLDPLGASAPPPRPAVAGRVLSAAELEETRDDLTRRVFALREERARLRRDVEAQRDAAREAPRTRPEWGQSGTWTIPGRHAVLRNGL
jgi:DNA-binding transcriptional regulator YhcF (GntR family)